MFYFPGNHQASQTNEQTVTAEISFESQYEMHHSKMLQLLAAAAASYIFNEDVK